MTEVVWVEDDPKIRVGEGGLTEMDARDTAGEIRRRDLHFAIRVGERTGRIAEPPAHTTASFDGAPSCKQIYLMIELIQRNYRDNLKLEKLGEMLNYNSAYLGKLFKSATGENFKTYLDKVRIERAKSLLGQGMKVYQVAEQVGYASVDYFHAKFRKYEGMSPSAYKKPPIRDRAFDSGKPKASLKPTGIKAEKTNESGGARG